MGDGYPLFRSKSNGGYESATSRIILSRVTFARTEAADTDAHLASARMTVRTTGDQSNGVRQAVRSDVQSELPLDELSLDDLSLDEFPPDELSLDDLSLDEFPPDEFASDEVPPKQCPSDIGIAAGYSKRA